MLAVRELLLAHSEERLESCGESGAGQALLLFLDACIATLLCGSTQLRGLLACLLEPKVRIDAEAAFDAAAVDGQPEGPALVPLSVITSRNPAPSS